MKIGDVRTWATEELHKNLTKIINAKQHRRKPYYLLVIIKEGYQGPPAFGNNNELLGNKEQRPPEIDLSNKKVVHNIILILDNPPPVPMINSSLWSVDNRIGEVKCIYILPPDKPMIQGFDLEEESRIVFECGKHVPIIYN